jgi:hypothetical protein
VHHRTSGYKYFSNGWGDIIIAPGDVSVTGVHRLLNEDVIGRDVPLTILRDEKKAILTVRPAAEYR